MFLRCVAFSFLGAKCAVCRTPICSTCLTNELSHPSYPTKRVFACEPCFQRTLLARVGQHTETVQGEVSNQMMLKVANSLMGMFIETKPGQPIKVKRDGFVLKHMPTAKAGISDGIKSEDFTATSYSDGSQIAVRWYSPVKVDAPQAGAIYFHGGGWSIGSIFQKDQDENFRTFAKKLNVMLFAVEYRLSPEHPFVENVSTPHRLAATHRFFLRRFPVPFEDCFDAYKYILENAEKFNLDPKRFVTLGDRCACNWNKLSSVSNKINAAVPVAIWQLEWRWQRLTGRFRRLP